ncbi:MAG: DUF3306 domain-containing protein [Alphaproteobacteria bacterium]|nr:DUF3306 domain-containing protein [Alphaproteobacteria bacterium]
MSESNDHFLARWARRKAEIARGEEAAREVQSSQDPAEANQQGEEQDEAPFDLDQLPKIEDITGETDIRLFMHKAVPEDLRNAALRRTWEVTDSIRNYLDPAREYAWDWNTPGENPGSPLEAGYEAAKLAGRMLSGKLSENDNTLVAETNLEPTEPIAAVAASDAAQQNPDEARTPLPPDAAVRLSGSNVESLQQDSSGAVGEGEPAPQMAYSEIAAPQNVRRRHGGATPA